jgi:hypothetical protein
VYLVAVVMLEVGVEILEEVIDSDDSLIAERRERE